MPEAGESSREAAQAEQPPLMVAWLSRSPSLNAVVNATRVQRCLAPGLETVLVDLACGDEEAQQVALKLLNSRLSQAYVFEGSQFSYGEGFMAYLAESWGSR